MVCGRPGLVVVVGVSCRPCGGKAHSWGLRWWSWDGQRSYVTVCHVSDFGSTLQKHAHARSCSCPNCSVHQLYSFVVSIV